MPTADITLVNPPPWGMESPPIGVSYLATYLARHDLKAEIYDLNADLHNTCEPVYRVLWNVDNRPVWKNEATLPYILNVFAEGLDRCLESLAASGTPVVGFSAVDGKEALIVEMVRRLKTMAPEKRVILGGPACHSGFSRQYFLDRIAPLLDAIVYGEGEETLLEWLANLKQGRSEYTCRGTLSKQNGTMVDGGFRPSPMELDSIPFPTFSEVELSEYQTKTLPLIWSRGCVCRCAFCKEVTLVDRYRYHSAPYVVDSLRYYMERCGVEDFFVWDSAVNGNVRQLGEIAARIKDAGIRPRWRAMSIPHKHMSDKLCRRLKEAGCVKLNYGVESGHTPLLRRMRKAFTREDASRALKATRRAGIECTVNLMVGFPGETDESVEATASFLNENREYIDAVESLSVLQVVDGTEIFESADSFGLILPETDWYSHWFTADGLNTLADRQRWARRLAEEIESLGIPLLGANTCLQEDKNEKSETCKDLDGFQRLIMEVHQVGAERTQSEFCKDEI